MFVAGWLTGVCGFSNKGSNRVKVDPGNGPVLGFLYGCIIPVPQLMPTVRRTEQSKHKEGK